MPHLCLLVHTEVNPHLGLYVCVAFKVKYFFVVPNKLQIHHILALLDFSPDDGSMVAKS